MFDSSRQVGRDLSAALRPAWATIDLDALASNLETLRARVAPAGVLAVLKADAYGHGAPIVARTLDAAGIDWLGVAMVEEAVEIRRAGVSTPVMVLGVNHLDQLPLFRRYNLTPVISSLAQLAEWTDWSIAAGHDSRVHLKLDVGMNRLGLQPEEVGPALSCLRANPRLELGGVLSHLAEADDLGSSRTMEQESEFAEIIRTQLADWDSQMPDLHLANSAAAMHHPQTHHTFVRSGLALFGVDPASKESSLQPVMSVQSRIVHLKRVPVGARPGYGATWSAVRETELGVVPIGYADGYSWRLSNQAEVLVRGERAPVIGAVSMDMTIVDTTDIGAALGDEVVLLGAQNSQTITATELADKAGTIPYEMLCHFGLRLPRRYRSKGDDVAFESQFALVSETW